MLWDRESLLMNSTRVPSAIWMFLGLTPAAAMVIVLVTVGGEVGVVGAFDPQPTSPLASRQSRESTTLTGSFYPQLHRPGDVNES